MNLSDTGTNPYMEHQPFEIPPTTRNSATQTDADALSGIRTHNPCVRRLKLEIN